MKGSEIAKAFKEVVARTPSVAKVYVGELVAGWETKGMPAVLIYRVGGTSDGLDRSTRFRVDVWAEGLSAASDVAEDIRDALIHDPYACSWHGTSYGLIDDVEQEQEPVDVPYPHATIRQVSQTLRVTTRAL